MFNAKRIIFFIGLLSAVALTGALLAGPAFAAPKVKVDVCHHADEETKSLTTFNEETQLEETTTWTERENWHMINVSERAVADHEENHGYRDTPDFEVHFATEGDLGVDLASNDSEEDCGALDAEAELRFLAG